MKFKLLNFISLFGCSLVLLYSCSQTKQDNHKPTAYYFNPITGNDSNSGTDQKSAFKSFSKLNEIHLNPGDHVLLANNAAFREPLLLKNIKGTKDKKIVFSNYTLPNTSISQRAIIDVKDVLNGISITDCSFIEIKNIRITASSGSKNSSTSEKFMRCGILVQPVKDGLTENITFDNLLVEDVFYEKSGFKRPAKEVKSANGTQNYGWGIRVINSNEKATIKDITIRNSTVKNVAHTGIKFTGKKRSIKNITVENCEVIETGGPGIQMSGVEKGHITNNTVNKSGSNNDSRKWGRGSGLWTWGSSDILIEENHFLNANGPGDSAGAHIDYNCENIVLQYNFSANNAGGFCEILGNNYNCAYRYNISVNDGHRVKGVGGAFQEGKTLWLSGYAGNSKRTGPYNSYIYNNTIVVSKDILSKYAFDKAASGVLIMNNIFYIQGESTGVIGDQYKPDTKGKSNIKNVIFKNNLFLNTNTWPKDIPIKDNNPLFGNPNFKISEKSSINNYIPTNLELIKDKGLTIVTIPNDSIGLKIGLKVTQDILGNPIIGSPDIGAIEINSNSFDE